MTPVAFAIVASAGLVALGIRGPRTELAEPGRDPLGVAYLRAAVDLQPDNTSLVMRLAREQFALGQHGDAEETITALLAAGDREATGLALDIAVAHWRASPPGTPAWRDAHGRAIVRLEVVIRDAAAIDELSRTVALARELGRARLAGDAERRAATLDHGRCSMWLARASRDYLAAGDPVRAAASSVDAFECTGSRALGEQALQLQVAADLGNEALQFADLLVTRFPADHELLARAESLALSHGDPARARRYASRMAELGIADAQVLDRLLDLDLAAGDLDAALRTAEHLAATTPDDPRRQQLAARVASWAGRPHLALAHWTRLARRGDGTAFEHALQIARELADDTASAELLVWQAQRRPLAAAELAALVATFERLGAPERAASLLEEHTRRSDTDAAWDLRIAFHERRRDVAGAIRAREELIDRRGATPARSLPLAKLLWGSGRGGAALAELARWSQVEHDDLAYWQLLAELAWHQESDELAGRAYEALWRARAIDSVGVERLIILDHEAGRHAEALRRGRAGWQELRDPRLLLVAMDEASHAGSWSELGRLRELATHDEQRFTDSFAYWMLSADLERRAGRITGAAGHYRRALAVDAGSGAARSGLLWMLIANGDREELRTKLSSWLADAESDPRLWHAYAAGFEQLGRMPEAMAFYRREADAGDRGARERYDAALRRAAPPPVSPGVASSRGSIVTAELGVVTQGPITARRAATAARTHVRDELELEARAALASITSHRGDGEVVDLLAGATLAAFGGRTELFAGAGLTDDDAVLRATIAHTRQLGRAQARVEAAVNDVAPESAVLAVEATRSRAGGTFAVGSDRLHARVVGEWKSWTTRSGTWLGHGGASALELGLRLRLGEPEVTLRLSGSYQRNELAMSTDEPLLPGELATAGVGIGIARWRFGRITLLGDAWLGFATPPLRRAYRLQSGLAFAPFANAELSITTYAANDHWVIDRGELGLTASLAYRFASSP